MNCAQHSQTAAVAYCRSCGKPLCAECERDVRGVIYCEDCLAHRLQDPVAAAAIKNPTVVDESHGPSPGLAAGLGFIPGVGAMYNGQFAKGVVHVLIFVSLIWMTDRVPLAGLFIAFFVFYMVFDAYKTAEARRRGDPLPDPFGLEQFFTGGSAGHRVGYATSRGTSLPGPALNTSAADVAPGSVAQTGQVQPSSARSNAPIGAVILIGLGFLFLLDNLGWLRFHWANTFWPVILIVVGVWLFEKRWRR